MIHIRHLQPADISFIMGTWNGIMGSSGLLRVNREVCDSWVEELKQTRRLESRMLGSRWSTQTSLQMSLSKWGDLHAHAYPHDRNPDGEERLACRAFEKAVAEMQSREKVQQTPEIRISRGPGDTLFYDDDNISAP